MGNFWGGLTNLGDSAVLLPSVLLVALWLVIPATTRRLSLVWLFVVAGTGIVVAITKLLYMGWHIGIPGMNFIGLSGHTTLSFLVWPVLLPLMLGRTGRAQRLAAASGLVLAAGIAISRVEVHAHSVAEVLLGALLGGSASLTFLSHYRVQLRLRIPRLALVATAAAVISLTYGRIMPTEQLLHSVARVWTGHERVYTRRDLNMPVSR